MTVRALILERWYDDTYHESAALLSSDALQASCARVPRQYNLARKAAR